MLGVYLESQFDVTGELAFAKPGSSNTTSNRVGEKQKAAKMLLETWQASWEKASEATCTRDKPYGLIKG